MKDFDILSIDHPGKFCLKRLCEQQCLITFVSMADKSKLNFNVFKRLLSYWKLYKRLFFIAVLGTILLAIIGPTRPRVIGEMVDRYITNGQNETMLLYWSLGIAGLILIEIILQFVTAYYANLFAQSIIRDLRKKLVNKIFTFPMKFFDRTPIGALVTRVVSDLEAITEVFSSGLMSIAGDLLALTVVVSWMFSVNWTLSLLVLVPIPILIIATRIFARVVRKTFRMERDAVSNLNTFVQERLSGMSLVQLFNRQKEEHAQFDEINKVHRGAHLKAVNAYSLFFPIVELLSSLSVAFMLVWTAMRIEGNSVEEIKSRFAEVLTFILWVHMLFRPIRQLADKFNTLQRGTVRAERVFELIDKDDHIENTGTIHEADFNQTVKFSNVFFAYDEEKWVLKDINLDIQPGSTVALVGAT